jgi:hypothetical protein
MDLTRPFREWRRERYWARRQREIDARIAVGVPEEHAHKVAVVAVPREQNDE